MLAGIQDHRSQHEVDSSFRSSVDAD
eukprot:SAG31_NODE_1545_length_7942_cov_6.001020_1_plen_25_part_10